MPATTAEELEEAVVQSAPRTSGLQVEARQAENANPDPLTTVKTETEAGPMMPLDKALASPEVMSLPDYSVEDELKGR